MLRIQSSDFRAAAASAKGADKAIIRELRRGIRMAGDDAVRDVKAAIGEVPSSGRYSTGVRAALQAGTRVSISTASPRSAGVRIVTDPRRLPVGKRVLAKSMNLQSFRHPVYGKDEWVDQPGRPYFGAVILASRKRMEAGIWRSLATAEREVMAKQREAAANVE